MTNKTNTPNSNPVRISDIIDQLEYIRSQYGDILVRISRAEYKRCSDGDSSDGRITKYDHNAITGPQWITNTVYTCTPDIDYTIHNNTEIGDFLELS